MRPIISIVLPVYNGEKYLKESIDSIISQSFSDWELIIVDDCSTDNTFSIVCEYEKKDSRIRVIHNTENKKLPTSLNIGFSYAQGKYLTWTSDDNRYLSNALYAMYSFLESNKNYSMVCTSMLMVDEEKENIVEAPHYDNETIKIKNVVGACFLYKESVREIIGNYSTELIYVEDYDYWLRILINEMKIGFLDGCYYIFRYHANSLSATKKEIVLRKIVELYHKNLQWLLDGIKNNVDYIMHVYNRFLEDGRFVEDIEIIKTVLPELSMETEIEGNRIILFGAGYVGKKAQDALGEKAVYFVDNNAELVGNRINGLEVLSVDEMINKAKICNGFHIVICATSEKQFSMIRQIINGGVSKYSLYPRTSGKYVL